jgi:hypothetical protein
VLTDVLLSNLGLKLARYSIIYLFDEDRILEIDAEKIAAYRENRGVLYALSAPLHSYGL